MIIRPEAGGQVCLEWLDPAEGLRFWFALPADYVALCNTIRLLGVSRVHIHHTLGLPPQVFGILDDLHLPWDFTAHDYYPCCPQITLTRHDNRYCGEPDDVGCNHCLKDNPAPGRVDITAWRDSHRFLIDRAERVFAPSGDVAQRYKRYFPAGHYIVANHPDMEGLEPPAVRRLAPIANRSLRIAVIGALSPMKGADLLEAAAVDAQVRNLPLRFCLFGYAYRHLRAKHTLEVRGPYEDRDLPTLLRRWQPDLVWFPAQWPETYSYTLSACLVLGLPVVATDLGAIAERLTGRPYSWILPWQTSADEWNEFFVAVARGSRPNDAAVRHGNLQVSTFSYADNYINHIPSSIRIASAAALVPVAWREHLRPRVEGRRRRLKVRIGRALVVVLARLRGYPWTARLARRIPVQVQRSIKNRLLGNEPKNRS